MSVWVLWTRAFATDTIQVRIPAIRSPPSIGSTHPVTYAESRDTRNDTTPATSSGVPSFPIGMRRTLSVRASSVTIRERMRTKNMERRCCRGPAPSAAPPKTGNSETVPGRRRRRVPAPKRLLAQIARPTKPRKPSRVDDLLAQAREQSLLFSTLRSEMCVRGCTKVPLSKC